MNSKYIKNPEYTYEKVNRASAACGPLVKWCLAQLEYANMLNKVEPLREELRRLEAETESNKLRSEQLNALIIDLEKKIAQYKQEYAELISEAQSIRADLSAVEAKVYLFFIGFSYFIPIRFFFFFFLLGRAFCVVIVESFKRATTMEYHKRNAQKANKHHSWRLFAYVGFHRLCRLL
jgi:cell division septum initiation protein DivIVA